MSEDMTEPSTHEQRVEWIWIGAAGLAAVAAVSLGIFAFSGPPGKEANATNCGQGNYAQPQGSASAQDYHGPHRLKPPASKPAYETSQYEQAPTFNITTVDNKPLALKDYVGKWVLLNFWATWCSPCMAEIEELKAVYKEFGNDSRFAMISLSIDDQPDSPRRIAGQKGLGWVQGHTGGGWDSPLAIAYGVHSIPAVFLINPQGRIVDSGLRGSDIRAAVAQALGKSPASGPAK